MHGGGAPHAQRAAVPGGCGAVRVRHGAGRPVVMIGLTF